VAVDYKTSPNIQAYIRLLMDCMTISELKWNSVRNQNTRRIPANVISTGAYLGSRPFQPTLIFDDGIFAVLLICFLPERQNASINKKASVSDHLLGFCSSPGPPGTTLGDFRSPDPWALFFRTF